MDRYTFRSCALYATKTDDLSNTHAVYSCYAVKGTQCHDARICLAISSGGGSGGAATTTTTSGQQTVAVVVSGIQCL